MTFEVIGTPSHMAPDRALVRDPTTAGPALVSERDERLARTPLVKSLDQHPTDRRERSWREIVEPDAAMAAIRRKARTDRPTPR